MAGSGEAGCKKCGWNMQEQGYSFSGGKNRLVAAASQDACEVACCEAGCDAFAYNPAGSAGTQCSIYSDCKPPACKASVWSSGRSAGFNTGCQAPPGPPGPPGPFRCINNTCQASTPGLPGSDYASCMKDCGPLTGCLPAVFPLCNASRPR
jgi:hypothetical protein